MANLNGQLILSTLKTFDEPATFSQIVNRIANAADFPVADVPHDIRESIQTTLNGAVLYGYIQCSNQKYSVTSVVTNVAEIVEEVNKNCAEAEKDGEKRDDNLNDDLEEDIKRKKSKRKYSAIGLPVDGTAGLKKDNKESAEAESETGNDVEGEKDNNQNVELQEENKRRKVDAFVDEVDKECVEGEARNDGEEKKDNLQADEMKQINQNIRRKKNGKTTRAFV